MSGCNVRRGFCLEHQCWTDEVRCRVSYLAAVVERLTAERDALREKVQRVERLLDRCDQDTYDFHWGEGSRASCGRCGEWCYPHDPCSCCEKQALGDQTAAEVLAEVTELHAAVDRVTRLHSRKPLL